MNATTDVPDGDVSISPGDVAVSVYTADQVATIPSDASLLDAAKELVADGVGLLVVGTKEHVEGVLSERDVVRAVAAGRNPTATPVREVASTRLVWCDQIARVQEVAEEMMTEYVRHVLVEADGHLVGVVSARDLLGAYVTAED
jgi:CBS domain-containing protein